MGKYEKLIHHIEIILNTIKENLGETLTETLTSIFDVFKGNF